MIIQHNILAAFTNHQLGITRENKAKSAEKLGSGYRINRAGDDAAKLVISEKMRSQVRGLDQADQNIQDGISLLQTADGAMGEVHSILQRMRELAVQSANDTNTDEDRGRIDQEYTSLKKEINRISRQTEFNTQKIIFDNTVIAGGSPSDIEIYSTSPGVYGGVVYRGVRYDWSSFLSEDDADPLDSADPKEGRYYLDTADGTRLYFNMEPGKDLPDISKEYDIHADLSGMQIDNYSYHWNQVLDEDGFSINITEPKEGLYTLDHSGSLVSFYVDSGDTSADVIEKLNASGAGRLTSWESQVLQTEIQPAVSNIQLLTPTIDINSSNQNFITAPAYTIYADSGGIQLNGYSKVSWSDLEISPGFYNYDTHSMESQGIDFSTGKGIGTGTAATFRCPDTGISFSFQIQSGASMDEVINGLNNTSIPSHIDADIQTGFLLSSSGAPVMTGASIHPSIGFIPFDTQRDLLELDFDADSWINASSLSGLGITYGSASFTLNSSEMNALDSFFRNGSSNFVTLTFRHSASEAISITFERTNNTADGSRPSMTVPPTAQEQSDMDAYVADKIAGFTTQFAASTFSLKSDQAVLTVNSFSEKSIAMGNTSTAFLFGVKPKEEDPLHIQAGANSNQNIAIYVGKIGTTRLGISGKGVGIRENAVTNIGLLDTAIELVSKDRGEIGAYQNRLEYAHNNAVNASENLQRSESILRDTDMATEMMKYAKLNLLEQVSQSILVQANQSAQGVMSLLK